MTGTGACGSRACEGNAGVELSIIGNPGRKPQNFLESMKIKVISVPALGGDVWNDELNKFLRGHKILKIEKEFASGSGGAFWSFCIEYADGKGAGGFEHRERTDYREVLPPEAFARFSTLRQIRKKISDAEGIPAFAVFTDAELAGIAQLSEFTATTLASVKGIGAKKIEKYGLSFIEALQDEKGE
jgi:superfamily II DNA helicase RecQ